MLKSPRCCAWHCGRLSVLEAETLLLGQAGVTRGCGPLSYPTQLPTVVTVEQSNNQDKKPYTCKPSSRNLVAKPRMGKELSIRAV
jgi:hypothetical protein